MPKNPLTSHLMMLYLKEKSTYRWMSTNYRPWMSMVSCLIPTSLQQSTQNLHVNTNIRYFLGWNATLFCLKKKKKIDDIFIDRFANALETVMNRKRWVNSPASIQQSQGQQAK
jgi:hypothetical protein